MAALTIERKTPKLSQDVLPSFPTNAGIPVAASTKIYAGSIVCTNAAGNAVPGSTSATLVAVGVAEKTIDNSAGIAGALVIVPRTGVFKFNSGTSADLVTAVNVAQACYVIDDNTVGLTSSAFARSFAGTVVAVDSDGGVWVYISPYARQVQRGTVTLVAGVATVATGVTINADSVVSISLVTPGAGTNGAGYKVSGLVAGPPGTGSFTITAVSTTGGATVATDVSVLNYTVA